MSVQTEIDRIITAVGAAYDAVEAKGGTLPTSETVANLAEAINSIPKETHQAVEQATPSLSLNAATGVVTAEATQAAGLVAAGTKKATMQLATQAAKTVTPSAAQQTAVVSGKYTTGNVVVAAVPTEAKTVELSMPSGNQTVSPSSGKFLSAVTVKKPATMLPENIKSGVNIGGVVGTLESGGGGSTSETWVLNSALNKLSDDGNVIFNADFTSDGLSFSSITITANIRKQILYNSTAVRIYERWVSEAYRKLIFSTPPTGDLLTWLQANGVKQPANLAVQQSKDVTVTSNGTTEITPDAPYDVMEKANVTVDVPKIDYNTIASTWEKHDFGFNNLEGTVISATGTATGLFAVLNANDTTSFIVFTTGISPANTAPQLAIANHIWSFNAMDNGVSIAEEEEVGGYYFNATPYIYIQTT